MRPTSDPSHRSIQVDPADPRPHLPALDGVRGLAILLVVVCHAIRLLPRRAGADAAAWQAMAAGWVGVDLFFVLSGFLITGILYDAKAKPGGYFVNFYARRILRIAPLYYGFLALYFYVLPRIPLPVFRGTYVEEEVRPAFWLYYYNYWGAFNHKLHGNLGVFWSLCVEEHFYLVWPVVVWLLARRTVMTVCLVLAAASFVCRVAVLVWAPNDHAAYLMTHCRLDGLCAGAFVALALRDRADWARLTRAAPWVGIAAAGFLLGMAMGQRHFLDNIDFRGLDLPGVDSSVVLCLGLSGLALLFGAVVALTVNAPAEHPLQRVFRNPALRSLGIYSYAIYVFHPLVTSIVKGGMAEAGIEAPRSWAAALPMRLAGILVVLCVTYALALLSYHLYEKHFLSLKRYFPPARRPLRVPEPDPEPPPPDEDLRVAHH